MTRTAKLNAKMEFIINAGNALGANGNAVAQKRKPIEIELLSGTTINKCDRVWFDENRSLAVGTEDLDIYDLGSEDMGAGAGKDPLGQALTFAEIVALIVVNDDADGTLKLGGKGDTTAWNSLFGGDDDAVLVVPPLTAVAIVCRSDPGYAVADVSNHILKVEAANADVGDWSIYLVGRSA